MSKEPASVINLLLELAIAGIRIEGDREEQWVSAPFANVFIVVCSVGHRDIMMPAQEAGERVSNSRNAFVPTKNGGIAANAPRAKVFVDFSVMDSMAQQRAHNGSKRDWQRRIDGGG